MTTHQLAKKLLALEDREVIFPVTWWDGLRKLRYDKVRENKDDKTTSIYIRY